MRAVGTEELTPKNSGKQGFLFVAVATTWQHGGGREYPGRSARPSPASWSPGISWLQQAEDAAAQAPAKGIGAAVKAAALNMVPPQVGYTRGWCVVPVGWGGLGWKPGAGTLQS